MRVLNQLGWEWRQNGALLSVIIDGQPFSVFVPLRQIQVEFGSGLAAVGCPLVPTVGEYGTVSGFFSSISRAVKRVSRKIKKAVPQAIRSRAAKIYRRARHYVSSRAGDLSRRVRAIARNPAELALTLGTGGAYALHSTQFARDLMQLGSKLPIPGVQQAAQGALAATRIQMQLAGATDTLGTINKGEVSRLLMARGIRRPGDSARVAAGDAQRQAVSQLAQAAKSGNSQAQDFFGALNAIARLA